MKMFLLVILLTGCVTHHPLVGKCIEITIFDRTCWGVITEVLPEQESFVIEIQRLARFWWKWLDQQEKIEQVVGFWINPTGMRLW